MKNPLQRRTSRRILAALPLAAFMGAWAAVPGGLAELDVEDEADLMVSTTGWRTDFSKHSVPLSEFQSGGPPRDGIPPIDDPRYESQDEANHWLVARDPVIAVALEQPDGSLTARAYPLQILIWHEIVNDVLGDRPVAVTFCPLCYTAIAYDRRLEPGGVVYDFGTTGLLRHSDLVMWDRQTESWWQQFSGNAIVGELTGATLTFLPAQIVSWQTFRDTFPGGDVLSRDTGFDRAYGVNPYPGYDDIDSRPFLFNGAIDDRLPAMERVVGVVTDDEAVAFPLPALQREKVVEDELGEVPLVVFWSPGAASVVDARDISESRDIGQVGVFRRTLDGQVLSFKPGLEDSFIDVETGSEWSVAGGSVSGPLAGERLDPLPHSIIFWFAWAAFQPDGRLQQTAE